MNILGIIFYAFIAPLSQSYYGMDSQEFFALPQANQTIQIREFDEELLEAAIFYATNEMRQKHSKPSFEYRKDLNQSSRLHAEYLAEEKSVDHINRKIRKHRSPYDRVQLFSEAYTSVAENLARVPVFRLEEDGKFYINNEGLPVDASGQVLSTLTYVELAREVVKGWMKSPGHRQNILGNFAFLGVGTSSIEFNRNGIPELYLVQNFAN